MAENKRKIGATDCAKVAGLSRFGTPLDVYKRIVEGYEKPRNKKMERGIKYEPILRADYRSRMPGLSFADSPGVVQSKSHEFATASPDDIREDGILVEYKTASLWAKRSWGPDGSDEAPVDYICQVTWGMHVCGLERAHIYTAFGRDEADNEGAEVFTIEEFRLYEFQLDKELADKLLSICGKFWVDHVLKRVPPE